MSGRRRFLWSTIVLLAAGCQSLPTGSTALFQSSGDDRRSSGKPVAATSERLRSFWSLQRRKDDRSVDVVEETKPSPNDAVTLPGAWGEDEILKMVVAQEFEGTSDEVRVWWMRKLAASDPEEIPRLLAERRQRLDAAKRASKAWSTDRAAVEAKAQQIILTEREEPTAAVESAVNLETSTAQPDEKLITVSSTSDAPATPGDLPAELTAPEPVVFRSKPDPVTTKRQAGTVTPENRPEDRGSFMASVFDVFGVGGERAVAKEEKTATAPIQPPGSDDAEPNEGDDHAGPVKSLDLQSPEPLQTIYWQEDLDKLIALLETQVAQQTPGDSPEQQELYIRQHVALRMLYLIASRRPEALVAIPDVPQDEQEFWTQMFWALSNIFDDEAMPDRAVRAAETVAQLRAAIRQRQSRAALQLQQTLFCQRIDGFGDFVPFPEDRFAAGQPVLIYTEVNNFRSASTAGGDFRTVLQSTVTIRQGGMNGRTMFQQELPQTEDRCRSRRSDYFHSYRIRLPDTLQPGPHVLILEVTDVLSGNAGRTTMNFLVR